MPREGQKVCGHGYPSEERPFEPVQVRVGSCDVTIESLIEANVFRGYRDTPDFRATYEKLESDARSMWDEESHGECYLSCRYVVRLNGKRYQYEHTSWDSPCDHEMQPAMCSDPFEARCATENVFSATRKCTDVHAGEYYGHRFEPIDETDAKPPP